MKDKNKIKHLYNTAEFSLKEINHLIALALALKHGKLEAKLHGKTIAMLFFNPSLRTRVSFASAMHKLGGMALDLPLEDGGYTLEFEKGAVMDKGTIEHVKDAANVLSAYCDAIAIRASDLITSSSQSVEVTSWQELKKDTVINSFMQYAQVPVINMESNVYHPCQGLGDAVTIVEALGVKASAKTTPGVARRPVLSEVEGDSPRVKELVKHKKYVLSWVPHPKALPMATPNSQMLSACDLGMDVVVTHPPGWELDSEILNIAKGRAKQGGGSLNISNNQKDALKGASVVCAKSWGALKYYGNWEGEKKSRMQYKDWIIDKKKMNITNNAYFMHCLPVRRNVEVTDEVLDSLNSLIYHEAENRMWAQMAVLLTLLTAKPKNTQGGE